MINISQIIRTRRKTIALIIKPDGSLIVRAPLRVPEKEILSLVEQKTSWIEKKQALVKSRGNRVEKKEYIDGETFFYLGKPYPLHIFDGARKPLIFLDGFYMNRSLTSKGQTCFRNWYRQQAASIITQRVEQYAKLNGIAYNQVKITSAQTRWGSCNSKGTLCFSWRLIMAPLPVIDYVVVHELVHIWEKNHGDTFWRKVKAIMPDYQAKIDWLKQNGSSLTI